jgi:ATP-dependent helicase HrpA
MTNKSSDFLHCQTRDRAQLYSLNKTIKRRIKCAQPVDRLQQKLESLLKKSSEESQRVKQAIPKISLQKNLPISAKGAEITELLEKNQVLIVAGETGCGKTTQLPKICLQAGLGVRGKIAHTQPRRVAATSVANRIAEEVKSPLGELVGYSVRFADKTGSNTRIKLMTDGILLAEIQSDPMLSQYEVIIIDEAHERSLNIDFLMGFLKQLLVKRKELKLIVTSATIDPDSFSKYFNQAPVVLVEGRTFPVEVRYNPLDDVETNGAVDPMLIGIANAVDQCMVESTGDILIFSHGEGEIKNISKFLNQRSLEQTKILPLYARLGIKEQQAIFKTSSQRKIVIATNVAETSLTIPNIVFVIDIGTARISRYSQRSKIQQLPVEKISRASAEQRKGRCGRICPGICIRLYSEDDFDARTEFTLPEIRRTNLSSVVLRLKAMKVNDVEKFPFIEAPEERQWKVAFNLLFELAAMDEQRQLTDIGRNMSKLPMDPQLARILLDKRLQAVDEMLIIASFLSVRDVRVRPHDKRQKADQLHAQYIDETSDILTIIKLWRSLNKQREDTSSSQFRRWCLKNLINFVSWLEWRNVYFQVKENLAEMNVLVDKKTASAEQVHRALLPGFISHLLLKTQEHHYQGARGVKVWIHPSSQFFKKRSMWLLSTELIETDKIYARSNVPIQPEWVEASAAHLIKDNYGDIHWRKNKGTASCFLNRTIFGLPIVNQRLIDYSKIDPTHSRSIFLLEGIAKDNLFQSYPFMDSNRSQLRKITDEEEKLRSSEIKIGDEEFSELVADILPTHVVNQQGLQRWLKKDWKLRNKLLSFTKQQLSQGEVKSIEEFPSDIVINGATLPLSYCFSPGEPEDGVTVDIPSAMLNQFKQTDFDWLVPGYLSDKILAVIKLLPKAYRKQMIPLAETARECSQAILADSYQSKPFKLTLIQTLQQLRDIDIEPSEIDLEQLPTHLKMKFRNQSSVKKHQTIKNNLADLLLNNNKSVSKKTSTSCTSNQANSRLYSWPGFDIQLQSISKVKGQEIREFRGLLDHKTSVSIENFESMTAARKNHKAGVVRLMLLDQIKIIKDIKNGWPDRKELELYNLRFGGFDQLLDWLAIVAAHRVVDSEQEPIVTKRQFEQLCNKFSKQLRPQLSRDLKEVKVLLKEMSDLYTKLSELTSEVYQESVKDIKQQLLDLWRVEHFVQLGESFVAHYRRYFKAIESRIIRIKDNFPKEQLSLEDWFEWSDWWDDLDKNKFDAKTQNEVDQLFWMLQEYRVSLFATNVKTNGSISAKRLQKQFDVIEYRLAL